MKIKTIIVLLVWLCTAVIAQDKLVFGVNPYRNPEELREIYSELIAYLEKSLNKEIVFVISKDYDHLNSLIVNGTVDIASVSPKLFASLRQQTSYIHYVATLEMINENGQKESSYQGFIVVRHESSIHTLKDLRGKKFGFTDVSSTSGYLYPRFLMKQKGIDPLHDFSQTYMLKKHTKVLQALLEKSIDAGAVASGAYYDLSQGEQQKIRIIAATEEIPMDVVIASSKLDQTLLDQIQQSLMHFSSQQTKNDAIVGFTQKPLDLYDRLNILEQP